ncbi:MAG: type II secretion system protein, partial [Sedimentisphaerales bacterium]|nr:type II secretion system protein [Sedimentisphaerales bacterium]
GFTLIELLVVVSIIALLVSILLPALAEARRQGKLAVDQANLHQIGVSLNIYASENNSNYPRMADGNWLFDVSYSITDFIIATGGAKEIFYCPLEGVKNPDDDIFWRAAECWSTGLPDLGNNRPEPDNHIVTITLPNGKKVYLHNRDLIFRVSGYFWLLDILEDYKKIPDNTNNRLWGGLRPGPFRGEPLRTWVTKSTQRNAADTEFVVDMTVSMGADPETSDCAGIHAGLWHWGVEDRTAHLNKDMKPRDGNCLFVDGHVDKKQFDEMIRRYLIWGKYLPYHWW